MPTQVDRQQIVNEVKNTFGLVPEWLNKVPDQALASYWGMMRGFYLEQTQIPQKYKELIGLAVSGATRCRYCTLFHTEGAKLNGATQTEINEASMMGAVTMMASTFINSEQIDFEKFEKETRQIVDHVRRNR